MQVPRSLKEILPNETDPFSVRLDDVLRDLIFTGPDSIEQVEKELFVLDRQSKKRKERMDGIESSLLVEISQERDDATGKPRFTNEAARNAQLAKSLLVHMEHVALRKANWDEEERQAELRRAHQRLLSEVTSARVWLLYKSRAGAIA